MRAYVIACLLAAALFSGMVSAQNDCYGTDIGDRVCCSTDGEEVYSCPNGWTCISDNRCQYTGDSTTVDFEWYYYVLCVGAVIFGVSLVAFCVRRCRRNRASYVTRQSVYAPINNQAHYQAYAAAPGQPVYGQPVMGTCVPAGQQV
jgi:hypothetical protein